MASVENQQMEKSRKIKLFVFLYFFMSLSFFLGCIQQPSGEDLVERGSINNVEVTINGEKVTEARLGDEITWVVSWQVWGNPKTDIYMVTFKVIDLDQPDHIWVESNDDKIGDGSAAQDSFSLTMPDRDLRFSIRMFDITEKLLDETVPMTIGFVSTIPGSGIVEQGSISRIEMTINGEVATEARLGDEITWVVLWQVWGNPEIDVYPVIFQVVDLDQPGLVLVESNDDKIGDGSRAQDTFSLIMPDRDLRFYIVMLDDEGQQLDIAPSQVITLLPSTS